MTSGYLRVCSDGRKELKMFAFGAYFLFNVTQWRKNLVLKPAKRSGGILITWFDSTLDWFPFADDQLLFSIIDNLAAWFHLVPTSSRPIFLEIKRDSYDTSKNPICPSKTSNHRVPELFKSLKEVGGGCVCGFARWNPESSLGPSEMKKSGKRDAAALMEFCLSRVKNART